MTQVARCPRCGATIPPGRTQCPACMVELGLAHERASDADESPSRARERRRAPPPPPEALAADFPQLEIQGVLGEGGMGVVYRARHKQLERDVALKILAPELAEDGRFEERFLREARALARLDHPGIVRVHDFGRAGARWFLMMELVDGTNLRSLMKSRALGSREALAIVPQICEALQYAHDEGVVHRDVKPENVLIDAKGRVKLVDFGLAKLVGVENEAQRTATGTVVGTPHYIAPEQLSRPREVDHRADIYSLGVVFYEMLTGELPLGRFEPPSKRVQVDVRLDEIVLKSLERAPERRYQHAAEVKTDVDDVTSHPAPSTAQPADQPAPRQPLPPRSRREATLDFLLYGLAWIAIGIALDFGAIPFCVSSLLLPLIAWRAQRRAVERGELRWTLRRASLALGLFPLGFLFVFAGVVAFADRYTADYDSGFIDVEHVFTQGSVTWHDLDPSPPTAQYPLGYGLEPIATLLQQTTNGRVGIPHQAVLGEPLSRRVLTELDGEKFWRSRWLLFAGLAMWFFALSLPQWKRGQRSLLLDGAPAARQVLLAWAPLLVLLLGLPKLSRWTNGGSNVDGQAALSSPCEVASDVERASDRARIALLGVDYQVHTETWQRLGVNDEHDAAEAGVTGVRVLYADARDQFARMRVTWRGLQRALPRVTVFLIERRSQAPLAVTFTGRVRSPNYVASNEIWSAPALAVTHELCAP